MIIGDNLLIFYRYSLYYGNKKNKRIKINAMGIPMYILALAVVAMIIVLAFTLTEGKRQETKGRYLRNGNWRNLPDNDEEIYNLLLNLPQTDFLTFPVKLPTLLETVLQEGIVAIGNNHLKKEDYKNLTIISDDNRNLWCIVECGYPIVSFMVYGVDGDDIEYINPDDVDLGETWVTLLSQPFWLGFFYIKYTLIFY